MRSPRDLTAALTAIAPGTQSPITCTFVVDELGVLRLADRSSEHVACADFRPVLAAGEITFDDGEVVEASNQSTGYCPEPSCWTALDRALGEIPHPPNWTAAFQFRLCASCGERSIVKDAVYECVCGGELPRAWTFERTTCQRAFVGDWVIDTIEEATHTDQDRLSVRRFDDVTVLALADGAGGTSGGREAAEAIAGHSFTHDLVAAIREHDRGNVGQSTAILAHLHGSTIHGASVGDSQAWARVAGSWMELTADQSRKPLVGSGRATPTPFGAELDALLIGSDGLFNYVDRTHERSDFFHPDVAWRLVESARLPNGELWDDLSAIVVRRLGDLTG